MKNPETVGLAVICAVTCTLTTAFIFERLGYNHGVEAGIDKTHFAIDQSIKEGLPFTFYKGDVVLVKTIKMPKNAHREAQARSELTYYRATHILNSEDK